MSVSVDVALTERDRLGEHVVTGANQVYKEYFMIPDQTENTFVVVASALGTESNYDSLRGMRLDYTLSEREGEQVALVCEELEAGGQVAVVHDVKESVCCLICLYLTKLNCL